VTSTHQHILVEPPIPRIAEGNPCVNFRPSAEIAVALTQESAKFSIATVSLSPLLDLTSSTLIDAPRTNTTYFPFGTSPNLKWPSFAVMALPKTFVSACESSIE